MKRFLSIICGACADALGFLAWNSRQTRPVHVLALPLEPVWVDHSTVVKTF